MKFRGVICVNSWKVIQRSNMNLKLKDFLINILSRRILMKHWVCPLGQIDPSIDREILEEIFTRTGIFYDTWKFASSILQTHDFEEILDNIQIPHLLIEGANCTCESQLKVWASKNPAQTSLEVVEGAGYCLSCDPRFVDKYNGLLIQYLQHLRSVLEQK